MTEPLGDIREFPPPGLVQGQGQGIEPLVPLERPLVAAPTPASQSHRLLIDEEPELDLALRPAAASTPREPSQRTLLFPLTAEVGPLLPPPAAGARLPLPSVEAHVAPGPKRRFSQPLLYGAASLLLGGTLLCTWMTAKPRSRTGRKHDVDDTLVAARLTSGLGALSEAERTRDWTLQQERAQLLLHLPEAGPTLRARAQRAHDHAAIEQANLLIYDRFLHAVAFRAADAAVLSYTELSEGSVYRTLGRAGYLEMRLDFVAGHLEYARAALRRRGCREAQPHLDAILAVSPESTADPEVSRLAQRCRAQPPARPTLAVAPMSMRTAAPTDSPKDPASRPPEGLVDHIPGAGRAQSVHARNIAAAAAFYAQGAPQRSAAPAPTPTTVDDAQQAYIGGNYRQAIHIAHRHTESDPDRAWRVIGGAACYLGDGGLVRETLYHLNDKSQEFVRRICQRNGLTP